MDDEAPARDRLRRLLSARSPTAADGRSRSSARPKTAPKRCRSIDALTPDLVFLDIQMPALSGLEVAARLQAPRPRIIFCTAYDRFAVDAFELHAVDYLLKPVNRERLARTVERISCEIAEQRRDRARQRAREAVRTQMRLMPAAAGESGLECAGTCVPADGVGGDYYDFLPLGAGGWACARRRVRARACMPGSSRPRCRRACRRSPRAACTTPPRMLRELNRLTAGTIEATASRPSSSPPSTREDHAHLRQRRPSAGLIVVPAAGCAELDATGAAVGWSADAAFEQATVAVAARRCAWRSTPTASAKHRPRTARAWASKA